MILPPIECIEDRISNLPDGIIGHILSRVPTKQAVGTCVLSRDWKYKWTSIYDIHISDLCRKEVVSTSFISFVDRVLDLTHGSKIRSFDLSSNNNYDSLQISTWISAVLSRGVQNLDVDVYEAYDVVLPKGLISCTSLTALKLAMTDCTLQVSTDNCFPNLKSLHLECKSGEFLILNDQSPNTDHLLLNFPVLQVLELNHCKFINAKSVEIQAPELISFVHEFIHEPTDYEIKICAPKLSEFCLYNSFRHNFVPYLPSIYYVHLYHYPTITSNSIESETLALQAHGMLKAVPGLTRLRLADTVVQALVYERRFVLPKFHQLKRFEFLTSDANEFLELLEFLQLVPNLEYLTIEYWGYDCKYCYNPEEHLPLYIASHLKEVKFIGFRGRSSEINLINLFVEKATKLERVFIYLCEGRRWINGKIIDQLQTLSSKNSTCVTILEGYP